nr:uncharacterized protein LOC122321100 [Drosophila bipectinata]
MVFGRKDSKDYLLDVSTQSNGQFLDFVLKIIVSGPIPSFVKLFEKKVKSPSARSIGVCLYARISLCILVVWLAPRVFLHMVNNSLRWIQFCYPKRQFANSTTLKSYST